MGELFSLLFGKLLGAARADAAGDAREAKAKLDEARALLDDLDVIGAQKADEAAQDEARGVKP